MAPQAVLDDVAAAGSAFAAGTGIEKGLVDCRAQEADPLAIEQAAKADHAVAGEVLRYLRAQRAMAFLAHFLPFHLFKHMF